MLELRPTCENCNMALPPDSREARICTYECTFCTTCVDNVLENVCPNCGGGFVPRPIRPSRNWKGDNFLGMDPASTVDAVSKQEEVLGRTPELVAADAGFYTQANEKALEDKGVQRISIPNRNSTSETRKKHQKQRWFKNGQRWRTGCEGRISVLKRRHGLDRCLYRGLDGMKRWVGWGVLADNLMHIGGRLAVNGT